jgi:hypothetical protein
MASRGLRDLGDGPEAVASPADARELRERGRRVNLLSAIGAAIGVGCILAAVAL